MVESNQAAGRARKACGQPETHRTTVQRLCACHLAHSWVLLCGRNGTFVVTVFSSGAFRDIKGQLQDLLTIQHPNDGQRTAVASDTTMSATDVRAYAANMNPWVST